MSDPAYALQVAEAAALTADTALVALLGSADQIRDSLDASGVSYPMVQIGEHQVLGETNTCFDPSEVYSTIHVWASGPGGRLQAKQITSEIRRILAQVLTLSGFVMMSALYHDSRHLVDKDPTDPGVQIAHSIIVFYYRLTPAP